MLHGEREQKDTWPQCQWHSDKCIYCPFSNITSCQNTTDLPWTVALLSFPTLPPLLPFVSLLRRKNVVKSRHEVMLTISTTWKPRVTSLTWILSPCCCSFVLSCFVLSPTLLWLFCLAVYSDKLFPGLFGSPCYWHLGPLFLLTASQPLLSDGLFCCLKHLIGGQVYIIRGESLSPQPCRTSASAGYTLQTINVATPFFVTYTLSLILSLLLFHLLLSFSLTHFCFFYFQWE